MATSNVIALTETDTNPVQVVTHVERIENNLTILLRCINIDVVTVSILREEGVIDAAKESRLLAEKANHERVWFLINWIKESTETVYESFLEVMKENEQQHVANLLTGNKEDDHVPLSPARHDRLLKIRRNLLKMIHNNVTLIAELISLKAITEMDAEDLSVDNMPNRKKNFLLINAILRRSDYSFECLYEALRNTHQTDAADYLMEGEVFPVHVNTTRPDLDEQIAESLNAALMIESMDETTIKKIQMSESVDETAVKEIQMSESVDETAVKEIQMYQPMNETVSKEIQMHQSMDETVGKEIQLRNGLRIVGATPGHSIVILIYCKTTDNMVTFTRLFNSGELQTKLEDILNRLFARIEPKSAERLNSSIRLDEEDILEIEEITGIEDWMKVEKTKICQGGLILESHKSTEVYEKSTTDTSSDNKDLFFELVKEEVQEGSNERLQVKDISAPETDQFLLRLTQPWVSLLSDIEEQHFESNKQEPLGQIEYWMREDQKRPTALRKLHGCEATTQTDEASLMKTITGELPEKYKSDPTLIRTIQMEAKKIGRNSIHGMAILDKELFITSESSKEVVVYDSMTFSFNRRWNLTELTRLMDIASCNKNKCLYILDSEKRSKIIEIWRVNSNGKLMNKWSTETIYGYRLSVTNESNVILVGRSRHGIFEYSPDGQLIREIKLSYNICDPWQAIELASGQFVISHGCRRCGSQHVSIVDKYEGIMKSFGVLIINEYMYQDPMYLFVDGNGFVMVADREKGQVALLDSDLEFKRNILLHGLEYSGRILLDESNGRLFVTEGTPGNVNKIFVFQF